LVRRFVWFSPLCNATNYNDPATKLTQMKQFHNF